MVSAIASIEDPNDTNPQDPNYDPQDLNYDPNDDVENIEVTEKKFDVKYAEDTGKSLSEALILIGRTITEYGHTDGLCRSLY